MHHRSLTSGIKWKNSVFRISPAVPRVKNISSVLLFICTTETTTFIHVPNTECVRAEIRSRDQIKTTNHANKLRHKADSYILVPRGGDPSGQHQRFQHANMMTRHLDSGWKRWWKPKINYVHINQFTFKSEPKLTNDTSFEVKDWCCVEDTSSRFVLCISGPFSLCKIIWGSICCSASWLSRQLKPGFH